MALDANEHLPSPGDQLDPFDGHLDAGAGIQEEAYHGLQIPPVGAVGTTAASRAAGPGRGRCLDLQASEHQAADGCLCSMLDPQPLHIAGLIWITKTNSIPV